VLAWLEAARLARDPLFVSVLVLGEIRRGVERLRAAIPARPRPSNAGWRSLASSRERTISIDQDIAEAWGGTDPAARPPSGTDPAARPPVIDGLMAATAKVHGLVMVTRDVAQVAGAGVRLLNPWEPPPG
jgi:predicted nucleic acid-binding protein